MIDALWITLIGMGLVFVAILFLWGLMALLVRITQEREEPEPAEADQPVEAAGPEEAGASLPDQKRRAAAAAVAVALSRRRPARSQSAAQAAGALSAWQAVQRANQVSQRVSSSRKKVVR